MVDQNLIVPDPAPRPGVQHAGFELQIGGKTRLRGDVSVTSAGLLSIGALVSSILLSTAVIVRVARKRRPKPEKPDKHRREDDHDREHERLRRM
jgi:hypothetical protein